MRAGGSSSCCEDVLAGAVVWHHVLGSPKDLWALVNSFSYSTGVSSSPLKGGALGPVLGQANFEVTL